MRQQKANREHPGTVLRIVPAEIDQLEALQIRGSTDQSVHLLRHIKRER